MKTSYIKSIRLASFALVLLLGSFGFSSCSKNSVLVGKWQHQGGNGIMEFRADGTFGMSGGDSMNGTYSFNGSELSLKLDGDMGKALGTMTAQAGVEGDTLTIRESKKDTPDVYTRIK